MEVRKIIHIDMDAFYASVEQLDFPEYRGKPLVVGSGEKRGVISAASYEARKYGVRSAMTAALAKKRCQHLLFVSPRFERYREVSQAIRKIFYEYTPLVEPLALDEAYLDVTHNLVGQSSATRIAKEIRNRIWEELQLTASAGISINKFVAKIASDYNKPNGQKTIAPEEVLGFLENLDIRKFYGVGKVTRDKMYGMGIFTGNDLKSKSRSFLETHFGKSGLYFYDAVRGIHPSAVEPNRRSKSVGAERTFRENISSEIYLIERLEQIAAILERRLQQSNLAGKTITLKLKYSDFEQQTRATSLSYFVKSKEILLDTAKELLFQEGLKNSVRLIGISVSNLNNRENNHTQQVNTMAQLQIDF